MAKLNKIIVLEKQENYREAQHKKKIAKHQVIVDKEIKKDKHVERNK